MSRHLFWIIMLPDGPTAFRANTRDELLPTLKRLQRAEPNATIFWFERNRLWSSPEHAREVLDAERAASRGRGQGWRPGGTHEDPRAKYQLTRDQKRKRSMAKWIAEDSEKTDRPDRPPRGDKPAGGGFRPRGDKPAGGGFRPRGDKPAGGDFRPRGDKPAGGGFRPRGDKPAGGGFRPGGGKPSGGGARRPPQGRGPRSGEGPAGGDRRGPRPGPKGGNRRR